MKLEVGGSRNTKGLCVQLRNVFSKATGSYERVIRRGVAHTCPASRGQEVLRMQEARHPCGEQKAWRREQGKGDAGPGMRVTGGKLAGCGEVGRVGRLGLE